MKPGFFTNNIPVDIRRLLPILVVPIIGMMITTYQTALTRSDWEISRQCIVLVTLVAGGMLWFRLMNQQEPFKIAFKYPAFLLSIGVFFVDLVLFERISIKLYVALSLMGTVASFFIFIRLRDAVSRALANLKPTILAAIMSSFGTVFFLVFSMLWEKMATATAIVTHFFLKLAGVQTTVWQPLPDPTKAEGGILLGTPGFTAMIYSACSGLQGIFLFFFLLSAVILIDWRVFGRWNLPEIYGIAFMYMFFVNTLRITAFFLFALHMHNTNPTDKNLAELFHSNIGGILYLIAFAIFITTLYAIAQRKRNSVKE